MSGALVVLGKVRAWGGADANNDPDSANDFFRSEVPATMIGLDVTLQTLLTYKELKNGVILKRAGAPLAMPIGLTIRLRQWRLLPVLILRGSCPGL